MRERSSFLNIGIRYCYVIANFLHCLLLFSTRITRVTSGEVSTAKMNFGYSMYLNSSSKNLQTYQQIKNLPTQSRYRFANGIDLPY